MKTKKIIIALVIVILLIVGVFFLFFNAQSNCQCNENDFDNFLGTWETILTSPSEEVTYYSNGTFMAVTTSDAGHIHRYNGTWEIENNVYIQSIYFGGNMGMSTPSEYDYEFKDNCCKLTLMSRGDDIPYPSYYKRKN